jgi:hypothetical protein
MEEPKITIISEFTFDCKIRRCIISEQDVVGCKSAHISSYLSYKGVWRFFWCDGQLLFLSDDTPINESTSKCQDFEVSKTDIENKFDKTHKIVTVQQYLYL